MIVIIIIVIIVVVVVTLILTITHAQQKFDVLLNLLLNLQCEMQHNAFQLSDRNGRVYPQSDNAFVVPNTRLVVFRRLHCLCVCIGTVITIAIAIVVAVAVVVVALIIALLLLLLLFVERIDCFQVSMINR
jgi:hypothetical protein